MMSRCFCPRQIEITLQGIEDEAGQFVSPVVQFGFTPIAVQADGVAEVFGKNLAVAAFAHQDVAQPAAAGGVVNAAMGASFGVREAEKYFAEVAVVCAVIPGLTGVQFWM